MMRVLVTGSEGFLGRHLVEVLREAGHDVIRYDLSLGHDILNKEQLSINLEDSDACIHLAAVADLYIAEDNPELAQEINVVGTNSVLEVCDNLGVRMLYASTCCVYGNNSCNLSDESSPVAPTEHYAQTKLEGEEIINSSQNSHVNMRLATFYGVDMRASLATSIFIEAAISGEPIIIHGTGNQTRCFTHVRDICSGILHVLENEDVCGTINISDDRETSILDLAEITMRAVGNRVRVIHTDDRDGQIFRSSIDSSRLREMGWEPIWSLEEGLLECLYHMKRACIS
jgi:UDP-glucose 4-epimerase